VRRNEEYEKQRVIGTLLGVVGESGDVEVRGSFPVQHKEVGDQALMDVEFHKTMLELHQRAKPKEIIVGWYAFAFLVLLNLTWDRYATGNAIPVASSVIHDFYAKEIRATLSKELQHPIHITIDTELTNNRFNIQAYTRSVRVFILFLMFCQKKVPMWALSRQMGPRALCSFRSHLSSSWPSLSG